MSIISRMGLLDQEARGIVERGADRECESAACLAQSSGVSAMCVFGERDESNLVVQISSGVCWYGKCYACLRLWVIVSKEEDCLCVRVFYAVMASSRYPFLG
jgi:hypothetical protein